MIDLDAIRVRLNACQYDLSASELLDILHSDVPALIAVAERFCALANTWRQRSSDAAANGSDARARVLAECADELEAKCRATNE